MKIYNELGYFYPDDVLQSPYPFSFVDGGRGTGKTYSILKYLVENGIKFILLRRTQTQLDIINKPDYSPFKSLNRDMGWSVVVDSTTKYTGGVYQGEEVDGVLKPAGAPIGYTAALSTFSNIRGFDGSDVEVIFYDEFIPEEHSKKIKGECEALLNVYETVNRNRELQGHEPVKLICAANSNKMANPIFIGLGLVNIVDKMIRDGKHVFTSGKRGLCIIDLGESEISEKKRQTALYRLSGNSAFSKMALDNNYNDADEMLPPKRRPMVEYKPICSVGEISIFAHKSNGRLYVTERNEIPTEKYTAGENDLKRFRRNHPFILGQYLSKNVDFSARICEMLLTIYIS